jgi:hypothetical protein
VRVAGVVMQCLLEHQLTLSAALCMCQRWLSVSPLAAGVCLTRLPVLAGTASLAVDYLSLTSSLCCVDGCTEGLVVMGV